MSCRATSLAVLTVVLLIGSASSAAAHLDTVRPEGIGEVVLVTTTTDDLPGTVLEAEERDDGDQSVAPWVIGSGLAALVAIGVGGTVLKRRMG